MNYDLIINNATILTADPENRFLKKGSIALSNTTIAEISENEINGTAKKTIDAQEQLLTPGFIDCHTHLVYAGNRSHEFEQRLQGVSYADIAKQGGGILSTVNATRKASFNALLETAEKRALTMLQRGTTTVEIKSGYGLDLQTEVKLLQVANALATRLPLCVVPTFLGAHALPPEYQHDPTSYINFIIETVLPFIAKQQLAQFVDAFCETIGFTTYDVERLFQAAKELGFDLKLHAEQLSDQKGAVLAANYQATSVDHIEYLAEKDCAQLTKTVAVLLPGAFYFLKETQLPPIQALRANNIPIAIATDANPGSSPFLSLPLMMNMGCILFGLTIHEAFRGVTINAAKALKRDHLWGSIEIGKKADLVLWETDQLSDLVYNPTYNFCKTIIKNGQLLQQPHQTQQQLLQTLD